MHLLVNIWLTIYISNSLKVRDIMNTIFDASQLAREI